MVKVTTERSKVLYDEDGIVAISSPPVSAKKLHINWKQLLMEDIIPTAIMIILEVVFIAYCFHRLGCF